MATANETESIASIGRQIASDASQLVRDEIALARAQLTGTVKALAVSIGLAVGALALLFLMAIFLLGGLTEWLGQVIFHQAWPMWLIVGGVFLALAVFLAYLAYRGARRTIRGGKATVGNVKEDVEWLRHLTKRNDSAS